MYAVGRTLHLFRIDDLKKMRKSGHNNESVIWRELFHQTFERKKGDDAILASPVQRFESNFVFFLLQRSNSMLIQFYVQCTWQTIFRNAHQRQTINVLYANCVHYF